MGLLRQEGISGLLLGVAMDFTLRQRLFEFINLCLGEVGVVAEIQRLQELQFSQWIWVGEIVAPNMESFQTWLAS